MNALLDRLAKALEGAVRTDAECLAAHRHDRWVLSELLDLERGEPAAPFAVVEASSTKDVCSTLRICRELGVPVVPFGGGSGVCGAIQTSERVLVLSTRGLDGLVKLDRENLTASFRAGTMGGWAERRVQEDGLTIGHWPQSIEISTVGGWVATRAAGQYSTAYGNIEEVTLALEVALPDGSLLRTRETPRAAAGPDLRQLFMGSEGALGVITEVTFSLRRLPELSRGQAFHFAEFSEGLDAARELIAQGWRPPVVRQYDAAESQRNFPGACPEGRALLILLHEGPASLVEASLAAVGAVCVGGGGTETDTACVDHWLEHRNSVPSQRDLLEKGIIADTIEVASTWKTVPELYRGVVQSVGEVPGVILASAHSSHSYRSGTNLYFTFAARPEPERLAECYLECWRRTMAVCASTGAGIAHHHGIGRVRRDVLIEEVGETGIEVLRAVKRALDPDWLLNPGALLSEPEDAKR